MKQTFDLSKINIATIFAFSRKQGAHAVWSAWRTGMREQSRDIKEHQKTWETLPDADKQLDSDIAWQVVLSFFDFLIGIRAISEEYIPDEFEEEAKEATHKYEELRAELRGWFDLPDPLMEREDKLREMVGARKRADCNE
jgi:hypothetical protein